MSKRRLVVTLDIDAGSKECGQCVWPVWIEDYGYYCDLLDEPLGNRINKWDHRGLLRCQPCLDAEVRDDG